MPVRALAALAVLVFVAGAAAAAILLGGGGDDDGTDPEAGVAAAVERELAYLDPRSSLVTALDVRFGEANWGHINTLVSRVLREYRAQIDLEERVQIPPNADGVYELLAQFAGLSFEEDLKPVLDGYLVVGATFPPIEPLPPRLERLGELLEDAEYDSGRGAYVRVGPDRLLPRPGAPAEVVREADGTQLELPEGRRYTAISLRREEAAQPRLVAGYRTQNGDLRNVVEKVLDDGPLRELPGYENTTLVDSSTALVGDDTLVFAEAGGGGAADGPTPALRAALDRGRAGRGYPARALVDAQGRVGADDPLVLAAGDASVARAAAVADVTNDSFDEADIERARKEVPYLAAVRDLAASLDIDDGGLSGKLRMGTDPDGVTAEDLPLAPAGALDLPDTDALDLGSPITSGSRDQSVTTSFAARVARALFSESDFVGAAERAERELEIRFEDEVLRQFDCPSVSVFDVPDNRFGARSCLRDPRAMRELLPRLRPHLPRIVTGLQGLGDGGMLGLLLVAPDAPATPSLPLAQVGVSPLEPGDGGAEDELLYEIGGLRDDLSNDLAQAGPDRVVFGMIGESFVVASDRELARRMAELPTRRFEDSEATAVRVPVAQLLGEAAVGTTEAKVLERVLEELVISAAADRSALTARARLGFDR